MEENKLVEQPKKIEQKEKVQKVKKAPAKKDVKAVKAVKGVRAVAEDIQVKYGTEYKKSDQEIPKASAGEGAARG